MAQDCQADRIAGNCQVGYTAFATGGRERAFTYTVEVMFMDDPM
jgi:hypothetical protein